MATTDGIWFVYRSPGEGPLSKRIRRLKGPSITKWFEWQIDDARTSLAPLDVAQNELGGPVDGLGALFGGVQRLTLHTPRSTVALRKLLREHFPTAKPEENIALDDHTLRIRNAGPERTTALYFFDDEALRTNADQFAYLLQEGTDLPQGESDLPFAVPFDVESLLPAGSSTEISTYVCILQGVESAKVLQFPGVGMDELAKHLCSVEPENKVEGNAWPLEIRAFRALIEGSDPSLEPALLRLGELSIEKLRKLDDCHLGEGVHEKAKDQILEAARDQGAVKSDPESVVNQGPHHATLSTKTSEQSGFEQWVMFDSRWAAAHAELALSILKLGKNWDPCTKHKPPRVSKSAAKTPKEAKPKEPKVRVERERPPRAPRPKASELEASAKHLAAWKEGVGDRTADSAREYAATKHYELGDLMQHPRFGIGYVCRSELTKCEVVFEESTRVLVHAS